MIYKGSCHSRKGSLLWFVPREKLRFDGRSR